MSSQEKRPTINETLVLLLVFINAVILKMAFINNEALYWALLITLPMLVVTIYHLRADKRITVKKSRRPKAKTIAAELSSA